MFCNDFCGYLKNTVYNFIWASYNFNEEFTKISQNKLNVYFALAN